MSKILDASGRPAAKQIAADRKRAETCPQCGAGKQKRVASAGFGIAHPVCSACGYEWTEEVWRD